MKNYLLKIADDNLIMGQSLSLWCGHGPYLEEDIALTNIALDYLGQANHFFQFIISISDEKSVDSLAFMRYEHQYLNAQLCEVPNGNYAQTILKIYFVATYQSLLYKALSQSKNDGLSGLAQKSLKEVTYHLTHSKTWLNIFANSTPESLLYLNESLDFLWEYTGGLFDKTDNEETLVAEGIAPNSDILFEEFKTKIKTDFADFGLPYPSHSFMQKGSRKGIHTEYMGHLLCEMQYMQRAYPDCEW